MLTYEKGLTLWVHLCQVLWEKSDKGRFSQATTLKHHQQRSSNTPMSNPQGDIWLRVDVLYWEHEGGRSQWQRENHGTIYWAGLAALARCCCTDEEEMSRTHWSETRMWFVVAAAKALVCRTTGNTAMERIRVTAHTSKITIVEKNKQTLKHSNEWVKYNWYYETKMKRSCLKFHRHMDDGVSPFCPLRSSNYGTGQRRQSESRRR